MSMVHYKSESTVATRMRSTLVKVDENLGVSQGSTTSITSHNPLGHHCGGHRSYQVNSPLVVDLLLQPGHSKPDTALISFGELLAGVSDLIQLDGGEAEGADGGLSEGGVGQL